MRKHVGVVVIFLVAASLLSFGKRDETIEQLIARAEAAPLQQQSDLFLEVAERELKLATEAFKADKREEGRTALEQIVKYSDKAHSAAIASRKRVKHTEIKLRQISGRLRDIKMNVDFDDQAQVQATIGKLEDFRSELLKSMFGPKNNND
jgi:DNA repair photolyase